MSPSRHDDGRAADALVCLDRGGAGRRRHGRRRRRGVRRAEPRQPARPSTGRQGSRPVRRCRTGAGGRCFLFDGSGRTRASARGLCAGDRLQGISAGAEERPERQDLGDLFRMGGIERPEDHHSLAGDRRSGNRRCRRQRDHEDADPPGVAHLDLGRDQLRDAAVRREPASRHPAGDRYFRRRPQQQRLAGHASRAMPRWRRASSSTACRSW